MSTPTPPSAYIPPTSTASTDRPHQPPRRQSQESTRSTRRKPVSYINTDVEVDVNVQPAHRIPGSTTFSPDSVEAVTPVQRMEGQSTSTEVLDLVRPPVYILHPDQPMEAPSSIHSPDQLATDSPPSYTYPPSSPTSTTTIPTTPTTLAQLPAYHPSPHSTSPHTLPRSLFLWGFLCPLLWILGVVVLCVPLKVYEDDFDLAFESRAEGGGMGMGMRRGERDDEEWEKIKRRERLLLDEKVVILRQAEIRWARYCAIALGCWVGLVVIVVSVVLYVVRK